MLLNELFEQLFVQPHIALSIVVVAIVAKISPTGALLSIVLYLAAKRVPYGSLCLLCLLSVSYPFTLFLYHLDMSKYALLGQYIWADILRGDIRALFHLSVMVTAIPIASIAGLAFVIFDNLSSDFGSELKRLSKGQSKQKEKVISEGKLNKRLAAIKSSAHPEGSILGVNQKNGAQVILHDKDANLHTLAIGTTGSGKTTALTNIMESAIVRGLPLIIVDGKGDEALMRQIKQFAEKHERKFYGFSMVGESVKYNPLASGGITSKKDRIIELRHWSEDHYRKLAEGYLQTVFQILDYASIKVDLVQLAKYMELPALRELLQKSDDPKLKSAFQRLMSKSDDIGSLKSEIENLVNSEIGDLFDCRKGKVLSLPTAIDENAIIYFCLQPLAFPAYANCLGKLIINDIKAMAASALKKSSRKTIYAVFDEFSVFAGDQIVNLINQGRGAGIHAILSTQSLSDLSRTGGEAFVGQVLNNCNNYLVQRQNNPADAETLSKVVGTSDQFQFTSQLSSIATSGNVGTVKTVKEYLIHPDEIKRLTLGEGFYLNKQSFQMSKLKFCLGMKAHNAKVDGS